MGLGKRQQEEDSEEDEVYQYPKTGSGPVFAAIEDILRCAICREVSEPPVSLPCCQQIFCSLCIRLYLDGTKPRCPICRGDGAQNQLVVSKELRSVCSLWKRHRQAIVFAARAASSDAGVGSTVVEGLPEGRRTPGATSVGQRRDGGRLRGLHYHSTKDGKMRELLRGLGLRSDGDKATMVARHKRLVLLDAASNDRETPLPRSELIRQVVSWEREKEREKAAARTASRSLLSAPFSSMPGAGGLGQARDGGGGDAQQIEIPKIMQDSFKALIARAKATRKRKASSSAETDSDVTSKKVRSCKEADVRGGSVANGASLSHGAFGAGGSFASPADEKPPGLLTPKTNDGGVSGESMGIPESSGVGDVGDAVETRILGVAGKMVRTSGPWRCIFSFGKQREKAGRTSVGITDASVAKSEVQSGCEGMEMDDSVGGELGCSAEGGGISGSSLSEARANRNEGVTEAKGDVSQAAALLEEEETVSNSCDEKEFVRDSDGEGAGRGAELLLEEPEGGLIYVNAVTGETAREPPPELAARAEEAEKIGDYLIFIPSRCFVSIAASRLSSAAKTSVGVGTSGDGGDACGEMVQARGGRGRALTTPDPVVMSASAAGRDGDDGSGVDACDHLLPASQNTGTPLSQPLASAGADSSGPAVPPGSRGDLMSDPVTDEKQGFCKASKAEVNPGLPLTFDLSQGASITSPLVGAGKASGAVSVSDMRDFVEVKGGGGTGPGETLGKWACAMCTLENRERARVCEVCRAPRPKSSGLKRASSLRMTTRRNSRDNAPQTTITSFAARSGTAACDSRVLGVESSVSRAPSAADGVGEVAVATASAGFPTVRSPGRSSLRSEERHAEDK